ncbi:unnamed protein product [Notodromas monacha]|uniref:PPM-type phosphatase domain-containing protein n=1 Tax=Notodromas monacha TaxID=399045 RepID=A0A7R9GBP9_9CRUS|nr:unnamed protein product [Notodromas monacha]CAG0915041.1 unnamed protein product [Notodromas monacha]
MFTKFKNAVSTMVTSSWDQVAIGREADSFDPSVSQNSSGSSGKSGLDRKSKFPYSRPEFLQLGSEDEVQVAGDHQIRPIIVPRDITKLPWNSGYAEAVNAGKSAKNEDQATIYVGHLHRDNGRIVRQIDEWAGTPKDELQENMFIQSLPYYYLSVFDGHAGSGAAVVASRQLHHILHNELGRRENNPWKQSECEKPAKLVDVIDHLLPPLIKDSDLRQELHGVTSKNSKRDGGMAFWLCHEKEVDRDKLVIGALESAFWDMDQMIAEERMKYRINGGCTALVALFILGKLYISNAGDSRGIIVRSSGKAVPMSHDFTPETERNRVQKLAMANPELLGGEYTHLDFHRRPFRSDIGQRILYRDAHMTGYAYKTVTPDDLKFPVVYGEGKRSRVLATIGVTRGFGDHDLKAQNSRLHVKPFLTPEPQVLIFDVAGEAVDENDVLVLGTDGLWDVTPNEKAAEIVTKNLVHFPIDDQSRFRYRYTSAAQDLVMHSRGKAETKSWRRSDGSAATIDDITAFVIPMSVYKSEYLQWQRDDEALREFFTAWKDDVVKRVTAKRSSGEQGQRLPGKTAEPKESFSARRMAETSNSHQCSTSVETLTNGVSHEEEANGIQGFDEGENRETSNLP